MTQRTVPHTRPAPQHRPGVRGLWYWQARLALAVLGIIPVIVGWVINAAVGEWVIRRPPVRRAARTGAAVVVSR